MRGPWDDLAAKAGNDRDIAEVSRCFTTGSDGGGEDLDAAKASRMTQAN